MRFLILFLGVLMAWPVLAADGASLVPTYEGAVKAYYEKDYDTALKLFENLASLKPQSGALYYNLGNVYYKRGELGRALLHYEKARQFLPRSAELKNNIKLIQAKLNLKGELAFSGYLLHTLFFWTDWISLSEYRVLFLIVSFCFWGGCFFVLLKKRSFLKIRFWLVGCVYLYLMSGVFLKDMAQAPGQYGIIIESQVDVKESYLEKERALFQIPEGTRVKIIDHQDFLDGLEWLRIELPQGQKGWLLKKGVGII